MSPRRASKEPRIISGDIAYSVRLKYVMFPLEYRDFTYALARNGYELARFGGREPPRPARIGYGGEIARKGEIAVHVDSGEGEVSVHGRSLDETLRGFDRLSELVTEKNPSLSRFADILGEPTSMFLVRLCPTSDHLSRACLNPSYHKPTLLRPTSTLVSLQPPSQCGGLSACSCGVSAASHSKD